MKLPLKEPVFAKYLYVGPDNVVHVLMPVVSGTRIGLDNTCKAVLSLQEFFGKGTNSNEKATLKGELLAYQEALQNDLSLLDAETGIAQQKRERLTQINAYLAVIKTLENHAELNCLNSGFPSYPRPLEALMQDRETSNLYSMVLRPTNEDGYLRSEATNPIFSVAHRSVAIGRETSISQLQQAFIRAYTPLRYKIKNLEGVVTQQVLSNISSELPVDFEHLRALLTETVKTVLNVSVDFTKTDEVPPIEPRDINQDFFEEEGYDRATTTPELYIQLLLGYSAPGLFKNVIQSPFNTLTTAEDWSIATQFLLGITNFYCVTQGKIDPNINFGQILDGQPELSQSLAQTLSEAQQAQDDIETVCLSWINAYATKLKLKTSVTPEDCKAIKKIFAECYAEIARSPHFDEFFLLDTEHPGDFVTHQGAICTHFATFVNSPFFNLSQALTEPLEKAHRTARTLGTEVPHKSSFAQGEVTIDTTTMDSAALQTLYELINIYKDPNIKKHLFAQLKQERPDFKPQIDAKQFLQHIAYGEQDEAEVLLQKDPELAQELLRANNIAFTDYSGRTFTCTAYEYAWWAKDAHMLKMLEKYIKRDEETRQFIFERVQAIEEQVRQASSSWFSRFFASSQAKPRGLHYTTQNREGQTIDHWEAHFDLTPVKQALQAYIDAYNKSPKKTSADWEALNKIWINVGLPQREVPAHIAQEYCHPNRSFNDVCQNKSLLNTSTPANLKRQLKFYNFETSANDSWFTRGSDSSDSGLGFSFAILRAAGRGVGRSWAGGVAAAGSRQAHVDLSAIEAIDEVRTGDLKKSLDNLNRPIIVQEPPSHGV